jgi:hypothetical protein
MLKKSFFPLIIFVRLEPNTQTIPDLFVAEHYGLQNTTCLYYSKDVASGLEEEERELKFDSTPEATSLDL